MGDDTTATTAQAAATDPKSAESAAQTPDTAQAAASSDKPKPAAKPKPSSSKSSSKKASAPKSDRTTSLSKEEVAERNQRAVDAEDARQESRQQLAGAQVDQVLADAAAAAVDPEKVEVTGYGTGEAKPVAVEPKLDKDTQAEADKGIHVVVAGESLADVATRFGVGTEYLAELNRLQTGYRTLYPGQELKLRP